MDTDWIGPSISKNNLISKQKKENAHIMVRKVQVKVFKDEIHDHFMCILCLKLEQLNQVFLFLLHNLKFGREHRYIIAARPGLAR